MTIVPIKDNDSDFSLVELKQPIPDVGKLYPYCKKHGAMNKVGKEIWRCIGTVSRGNDNNCRCGCVEVKQVL